MNQLVFINNGQTFTDSLTMAAEFQKDHDHVMRDIRQQISKLIEAGEGEWGISNFGETQYQHPQNKQWYPRFDLTEDAFAIVAMSYVTPEAMKMKVRFLEEFKRMRNQLQPATIEDLIIMQAQAMKDVRLRVDVLENRTNKAAETVKAIKETFLDRDEDWRSKMTGMIRGAGFRRGKNYQDMWNLSYQIFEERARCRLDTRLDNLKERLKASGATKTKISAANKLDIIESEPRLKEIYTTIVKELSIGTMQ